MKEVDTDKTLKRELVHREVRQTLQQNPVPMLIQICDKEAKKMQMKAKNKDTSNNMRHCRDQLIMKEDQIASLPVNELIREAGAEEEEENCTKKKCNGRDELVDKKARLNMKKMRTKASAMKCYYG